MNDETDPELLHNYAESRSDAAFAELVRRHVDFVYSAALRMVRDSHLAEDVAQEVFVAFAKNATQLTNRRVVSGWLHRTAQNIAAQTVRTIERRRAREQEVAAMNELLSADPDVVWDHIAPHLDEALAELSDEDRDALLLRYFERKSAREMAQTLATSEEAAQKRVSRAVERLREFFARRGHIVGASGFVAVISTNAVRAAPVGLAATITAAASSGTTITTAAGAAATKAVTMTTLQKTVIATVLIATVGAGVYEGRQASNARDEAQILRTQQTPLTEQIQQLQRERDETARQLASLSAENERLSSNTAELLRLRGEVALLRNSARDAKPVEADPILIAAKSLLERVNVVKQWVEQKPEEKNPEFQYLHNYDWIDAVKGWNELVTNWNVGFNEPKNAMIVMRAKAKENFAFEMSNALRRFVQEHNGDLPTDLSQLNTYLTKPMNDSILKSYKLLHSGKLADLSDKDWLVEEIAPPFDNYDFYRWVIKTDDSQRGPRKK